MGKTGNIFILIGAIYFLILYGAFNLENGKGSIWKVMKLVLVQEGVELIGIQRILLD